MVMRRVLNTLAVLGCAKAAIEISLERIASNLAAPIMVENAGDGSNRLFILDQTGVVKIVNPTTGKLEPEDFLDISSKLRPLSPGYDERGLLGLAFHPDYVNNGRIFTWYSSPVIETAYPSCDDGGFGCHAQVLSEFTVSPPSSNTVDISTEKILFGVDQEEFNHNGGRIAFGPDGFLYVGLGDGGGANDGLAEDPIAHGPMGNGQNRKTPQGSILRIDVDGPGPAPYTIPVDNPFVGSTDGTDERIWAYGLRNPYIFSFDIMGDGDGSLWAGDAGQDLFEEVDIIKKGGNYGWVSREGYHCFDPLNPKNPPITCATVGPYGEPLLDPVMEYEHGPVGISVIGGFVYRGSASPALVGKYIFGDFAANNFVSQDGKLYYMDADSVEGAGGVGNFPFEEFVIGQRNIPYNLFVKGFGQGEDGEVYVCGSTTFGLEGGGVVERIVAAPPPSSGDGACATDCCTGSSTPGCEDDGLVVEQCVCVFDSYCCDNAWDQQCVDEAVAGCSLVC